MVGVTEMAAAPKEEEEKGEDYPRLLAYIFIFHILYIFLYVYKILE